VHFIPFIPERQRTARQRRKAKNKSLTCYCMGWWFPHRRGSLSSEGLARTHGTNGCEERTLNARKIAAQSNLLAYIRAEIEEGRDLSLTNRYAKALMAVVDSAEKIAAMKTPSVSRILHARGFGFEASAVTALTEAVKKLESLS
jgi:hypothetical protein